MHKHPVMYHIDFSRFAFFQQVFLPMLIGCFIPQRVIQTTSVLGPGAGPRYMKLERQLYDVTKQRMEESGELGVFFLFKALFFFPQQLEAWGLQP